MSITNLLNQYNDQSLSIQDKYKLLKKEIDELNDKDYLEKEKTVEVMYVETTKLKDKEYILFTGTSILTAIIILFTYKIAMK